VASRRDVTFFEDGLPPPTLRELASPTIIDYDKPIVRPPPDAHPTDTATRHDEGPAPPSMPVVTPEPAIVAAPRTSTQPRLTIGSLDAIWIVLLHNASRPTMRLEMLAPVISTNPMTNPKMVAILSTLHAMTCPSYRIAQCGPRVQASIAMEGGDGSALLVVDSAECPHIEFSVGLPGGIRLSELPDPGMYVKRWPRTTLMGGRRP
jgi:hypothetical protein